MEFSCDLPQKLHLFSVFFQIDGENSIWIAVLLFLDGVFRCFMPKTPSIFSFLPDRWRILHLDCSFAYFSWRNVQQAGRWTPQVRSSGTVARALEPFTAPACVSGVRGRTKSLLQKRRGLVPSHVTPQQFLLMFVKWFFILFNLHNGRTF